MALIREYREYATECGGCGHEYGERCDTEGEALLFIEEFPFCSNCTERGRHVGDL